MQLCLHLSGYFFFISLLCVHLKQQQQQQHTNLLGLKIFAAFFCVIYDSKRRVLGFRTVGWTKEAISRRHFEITF